MIRMLLEKKVLSEFYSEYSERIKLTKSLLKHPLTLTEKILFSHAINLPKEIVRGESSIDLAVDRIAMQDATAQMALLQFMLTGKDKVAVPTTIHCDHLILANKGRDEDVSKAIIQNSEVYDFLRSAANKYGLDFWNPGSGIIHQVVLENYACPGTLMIGTDSHTPNAGGLGVLAIGVGGNDAVDVMAGELWSLTMPRIYGIKLNGILDGWASPKDIILKVCQELTVKGGTGYILEYFGEGTESISATGKATITNMGAELGATTSIFPYDHHSKVYLETTGRDEVARIISNIYKELRSDFYVETNPTKFYDKVLEIDLNELEPQVSGPHTPDIVRPISKLSSEALENGWPLDLNYVLIGSCTNSSYEDMQKAAAVARQAAEKGRKVKSPLMVTPGSQTIYETIKRDGILEVFEKIGAVVLANACGPCIGQWSRSDIKQGEKNSIFTSYNRNFQKRNDGNPNTYAFIGSPEIAVAMALGGSLSFNPLADDLKDNSDVAFKLKEPVAEELPSSGFVLDTSGLVKQDRNCEIIITPESQRLSYLPSFEKWDIEKDFKDLRVLVKVRGKCTTDHISPAGPWLRYRGHLDKISDNLFSGATNAFTGSVGKGTDQLSGSHEVDLSKIAKNYNTHNIGWVVIGDENYGEGSSREHAAMSPRYLGCRAIIAKNFARIHEVNLKRQGVLPLWLVNINDYEKFRADDLVTIAFNGIEEGKNIEIYLQHAEGVHEVIAASHTFKRKEIEWFYAGSALNYLKDKIYSRR